MIKLGVIGTNWITQRYVEAAEQTGLWQLTSVYSRTLEKAQTFGKKYPHVTEFFDESDAFFNEGTYDTVYIASPNSMHFEQAKAAILAGKNVIVEKPACTNPEQMKEIVSLLRRRPQQYFFEAARNIHDTNYLVVKKAVQSLPDIQGATLTYMKYSSRYDAFLAGERPNIFSPHFAGGALQDLGVYLVHAAVGWFGVPLKATYFPTYLENGIDAKGIAILEYSKFSVTLNIGKTSNSYLDSEIYGLKETIMIDSAADLHEVKQILADGRTEILATQSEENELLAEAKDFGEILTNPTSLDNKQKAEEWLAQTIEVNKVMYLLRQSCNLYFDGEVRNQDLEG
ncbi:Gfo/Idh/MocA family oxidoreductase [Ligilactobacillus sp. WILCCON 0076]|uniref:Gfo/Idh/MocA family oxidoreductase n=1 Tax=Ligilactobacillus ubinensis TaxID=2876789 RepID=A0A9X2FL04_9LACO|nr:Gfo/Idh/MocA family oxidoreductase [Ligilactobacillus ubinensis]MCP0887315.1 Gfo/Idh/MocA family oxidoreductase [Ligilactobacillus ubinensis]